MNKLKKVYEAVCRVEEALAGFLLVVILVLVFAAAVGRTFGHPISWAMDMSVFLFAWTVFFSADVAMRKDKHVNVDFLVSKLPEKVQYYLKVVNYLIIDAFIAFLIVYGIPLSYFTRFRTFQGIPGFSYMWATLSLPVGGGLLLISSIIKTRQIIRDKPSTHAVKTMPKNMG
ncbi:MAG: TRAP transporter small permease [Firmicutes bacterium]|nr:TRAP transporter small permease [Bacillota bacterium]